MARRRKTRRGKKNNPLAMIAGAMILATALLGIAVMGYLNVTAQPTQINAQLCIDGQSPPAVRVVLIDTTDEMPGRTSAQIMTRLETEFANIPEFSKISIFEISDRNSDHIKPLLQVCRPPSGENANQLVESPLILKQRYEAKFRGPLTQTLDRLASQSPSNTSPILESVSSALIEDIEPNINVADRKLIVISDLLQHSSLYSMYAVAPSYKDLADVVRATGQGNFSLSNTRVELWAIPRAAPQGTRQQVGKFWLDLLQDRGAAAGSKLVPLS